MQPPKFNLRFQLMRHKSLKESLDFFGSLGGAAKFESCDGDWALLRYGDSSLSLLAHRPGVGDDKLELQFVCYEGLDELERLFQATSPSLIKRGVGDKAFGRMAILRAPSGTRVKVGELIRTLVE